MTFKISKQLIRQNEKITGMTAIYNGELRLYSKNRMNWSYWKVKIETDDFVIAERRSCPAYWKKVIKNENNTPENTKRGMVPTIPRSENNNDVRLHP